MAHKVVFSFVFFLAVVSSCHGLGCRNFLSSKGNFSLLAKPWTGTKVGYYGESILFNCTTNDENATVSLQYYEVGDWLNVMTLSQYFPKGSLVQKGQIFVLNSITSNDQASHYRCIAKSQQRQICLALGSIALIANPARVPLSIFPEKIKAVEGQNFKFICSTRSYPSSYLKWFKRSEGRDKELDSSLLERKDHVYGIWVGQISVEIKNAAQTDAGTYVCERFLPLFVRSHRQERTINVVVEAPTRPIIKLQPSRGEITIREERRVKLVCKHVGGRPNPVFKWINPKGRVVNECDEFTSQCTLFIELTWYENDHGRYTCIASSSGGTSSQSVFLNILATPEIPNKKILHGN